MCCVKISTLFALTSLVRTSPILVLHLHLRCVILEMLEQQVSVSVYTAILIFGKFLHILFITETLVCFLWVRIMVEYPILQQNIYNKNKVQEAPNLSLIHICFKFYVHKKSCFTVNSRSLIAVVINSTVMWITILRRVEQNWHLKHQFYYSHI